MLKPWLVEAIRRRTEAFASQLRSVSDGSAGIEGLDWTVADLGQHVACLPSNWRRLHAAGAGFVQPADFTAFSDQARGHITETSPPALADLIVDEYNTFVAELETESGQRWAYGLEVSADEIGGSILSEMIVHGRDLCQVTGAELPMFTRDEANAAADGTMAITPAFIDSVKAAAQPDGIYHIHFRGGNDYTWTKRGGQLLVTKGKPDKADAHLNTDPAIFMLSSLGRIGQVQAAMSGKMITYGKRPFRFLGLGKITASGV